MSICRFHCFSIPAALALCLAAGSSVVAAASHCKGMSEENCLNDTRCGWVDAYMRKDGRKVGSHCRLRPGQKSADAAMTQAAKASRTD